MRLQSIRSKKISENDGFSLESSFPSLDKRIVHVVAPIWVHACDEFCVRFATVISSHQHRTALQILLDVSNGGWSRVHAASAKNQGN